MKFAYPQDATSSVSAIRRLDEASDAATQQSNLERKQDIATVGETVPLIFCNRSDYGNDNGITGGVWVSPMLIQLGVEQDQLSMMYLLSQGRIEGLDASNMHWGYALLNDVDPSAVFCYAYEAVPDCLDLDYEPGGSLSWTTSVVTDGPNGTGQFVTENNCQKIVVAFNSTITVQGSGSIVGGFGDTFSIKKSISYSASDCRIYGETWTNAGPWKPTKNQANPRNDYVYKNYPYTSIFSATTDKCGFDISHKFYSMGDRHHLQASWSQTSEVRVNYQVFRQSDNVLIRSGQLWIQHGATSITIDGLEPDKYRVVFSELYKERNKPYPTVTIPDPQGDNTVFWEWYMKSDYPKSGPASGFFRHTNPGSETQSIVSTVTQTIYNELQFPDLPGGDQQILGGLQDLTMIGINGSLFNLRPVPGPEYFKQVHLFVEQGIQVKSLLTGRVEPSKYYPDLVRYLFEQTQALSNDQIDVESLTLACRMHQRYSMFYNGVLQTTSNLATWLTKTAPYFLCTPRQVDGRYGLAPIAPLDSNYEFSRDPVVPDHIFGADEIAADSYTRTYISPVDRKPICLVMVYRDQPQQSVGQTVTVEVRYPGTALSGPFEQHDLSEFCCIPAQATYAARYILAKRRYTTHTCTLTVNRVGRNIIPGQIVRVDLALQTSEGAGVNDQIFYQVESVQEGQGGMVALELIHFPVDSNGVSIIAKEVHEGAVTIQ